MVTRNIKANTATQVNSNLIGVLVNPNTNPPIVTVDDIVVDYTYTTFVVSNVVPDPNLPGEYIDVITGSDNNVYYTTGDLREINGNKYLGFILWPTEFTEDSNIFWCKLLPEPLFIEIGSSLFNIDFTDEQNPVITDSGIKVGALFLGFDDEQNKDIPFIQNTHTDLYNPSYSSTYQVDGDFLIDVQSGYKVGYIMSGPTVVTEQNVKFPKAGRSGIYYDWQNNDGMFGSRLLYTTTDSPAVGDSALFTSNQGQEDYNVQTIKAIDTIETPAPEVPIDCKLSYSVDGNTWTDWPENITDDNNVISNIPRYMYLKFSQDVVITEE